MMNTTELREAVRVAVAEALRAVGVQGLRATSMFPSSEAKIEKQAA